MIPSLLKPSNWYIQYLNILFVITVVFIQVYWDTWQKNMFLLGANITCLVTKYLKFYSRQANFCAKVGKFSNLLICFPQTNTAVTLNQVFLSKDFRNDVIQMAVKRPISEICERYRINRSTVHKYTKQYRETGTSTRLQESTSEHQANCCSVIPCYWRRLSKVKPWPNGPTSGRKLNLRRDLR